jgi:hypothetical protein
LFTGPLAGLAASCRTQLPGVSTQCGRSRHCVSQRGCLFILVAMPVCSGSSRHSSSVCLAGSKGALLHRANPTDLRHPCGTTDALIVPKHSGIKPLSNSTADASLRFLIASQASTVSRRPNPTRRARPVVSQSFGSRYATRLLCFPCRVTRNSKTSGAAPDQVLRHRPDAVPHLGFYLPALACKARTGGLPLSLRCRCLA